MPITLLYYFFMIIIVILLIINVVFPLLTPGKYKIFFMFRKDKYKEAVDELEETLRQQEINKLKTKMKENKKEKNNE